MYNHDPDTYSLVIEARYLFETMHDLNAATMRGETHRVEFFKRQAKGGIDNLNNLMKKLDK